MSNEESVQAIEQSIKRAKAVIEFGKALERLRSNKDFKTVIMDGYFEKEAIRLVHLKAEPSMQKPESQQSIVSQIDAIGALHMFLNTAMFKADLAGKSIEADEAEREELLAEGQE